MKRTLLVLLVILFISSASFGQKRSRSTAPKPSSPPAATQRLNEVRSAGAARVADQIKLLARFMYLLGGTTESIKRDEGDPDAAKKNPTAKNLIRGGITGFREGLDKLEIDFRATPELQPYYIKLAGVAASAATAEQQAGNGQFDAASRSLLAVVSRLADVLVAMRM